jgi:hypothetical protein
MRRLWLMAALCLACTLTQSSGDEKKNADSKFYCIDLQPMGNAKVLDMFSGDDNGDGKLPPGERTWEGVKFKIGAKYLPDPGTIPGPLQSQQARAECAFISLLLALHPGVCPLPDRHGGAAIANGMV